MAIFGLELVKILSGSSATELLLGKFYVHYAELLETKLFKILVAEFGLILDTWAGFGSVLG